MFVIVDVVGVKVAIGRLNMAIAVALFSASPAFSAVELITASDFFANRVVTSSHTFPYPLPDNDGFGAGILVPSPLIFDDVALSSPGGLVYYGDAGDYIAGRNGLTITAKRAYAIAFTYDSYFGSSNITLSVDNQTFDLGPSGGTIGVISDHPIGPVTFGGGGFGENDLYALYLSAVPEPATWIGMVVGFGLIGGIARRRRVAMAIAV